MVLLKLNAEDWTSVHLNQVIEHQLLETTTTTEEEKEIIINTKLMKKEEEEKKKTHQEEEDEQQVRIGIGNASAASSSLGSLNSSSSTCTSAPQMEEEDDSGEDMEVDMDEIMKTMVPIMVKSDLPELQQRSGEGNNVILTGRNMNWLEFVKMFSQQDPGTYVLKGEGGRVLLLEDKIGDYIDSVKNELGNDSEPPCFVIAIENGGKAGVGEFLGISEVQKPSKVVKRPRYTRRRRGSPKKRGRKPKAKIAQELLQQAQENGNEILDHKMDEHNGEKGIRFTLRNVGQAQARHSLPAENSLPAQTNFVLKQELVSGIYDNSAAMSAGTPPSTEPITNNKVAVPLVSSNKITRRRRNKRTAVAVTLVQNVRERQSTIINGSHLETSERQQGKRLEVKPKVMNFLRSNTVSNRNMLRVREELMKLKEKEDYFKLTAVAPLAAGLLEQMLCRDLAVLTAIPKNASKGFQRQTE